MSSLFSKSISLRKSVQISDEEFVQLRDFIYQKSGIYVDERRKYLFENRFTKRLGELGLNTFSDYINFLKFDSRRDQEMTTLFELITTNETSFFRDMKQLDAFRDNVLKEVIDKKRAAGKKELTVWSAGCSSGEEPYTLSIIVQEVLGAEFARWQVKINAVDLSEAMIAKAKAGIYPEYAFKTTPDDYRQKYFTPDGDKWKIKPEVTRPVRFQPMNLNDAAMLKRVPRSDIIFCRNVVIYFDMDMKKRVVSAFYDNLVPGGYLMLGHSETLHKVSQSFKPVYHPGTIAYLKEG